MKFKLFLVAILDVDKTQKSQIKGRVESRISLLLLDFYQTVFQNIFLWGFLVGLFESPLHKRLR